MAVLPLDWAGIKGDDSDASDRNADVRRERRWARAIKLPLLVGLPILMISLFSFAFSLPPSLSSSLPRPTPLTTLVVTAHHLSLPPSLHPSTLRPSQVGAGRLGSRCYQLTSQLIREWCLIFCCSESCTVRVSGRSLHAYAHRLTDSE